MGMTLAQYIISRRMEKAKERVLEGMQVQDIAISLGYEDRPYFTELFKKYTGMTPDRLPLQIHFRGAARKQ
jgi:two-component system response regulator YesN